MRRGKAVRWHIDHLTEAGTVLGAWAFIGGDECDLVAALSSLPVSIDRFGSTDCARCHSHLFQSPTDYSDKTILFNKINGHTKRERVGMPLDITCNYVS